MILSKRGKALTIPCVGNSPPISCVIPVYNAERWLAEAIESLLAQTRPPSEIVVIDDGSTDGSQVVAAAYGERVRYARQDHAGPATARNLGIEITSRDLVAFLDADDIAEPDRLKKQVACFDAIPDLDVCLTYIQRFWIPELAEEEERLGETDFARPRPGTVTQSGMVRRELLERVVFDPSLMTGEDQDWLLRAREAGARVHLIDAVLVRRRMHFGNVTRRQDAVRDDILVWVRRALHRQREAGGGSRSGPYDSTGPPSERP
ncbi:MAG: glycosyltransferase family 2 protein [Gemmatimonadota bacterium]